MARILILPTWMGTQLRQREQTVWLDMSALRWGDFTALAVDQPNIQLGPLLPAYQPLLDFLRERGHTPIPFPWDWRDSFLNQAGRLDQQLRQLLDESPQLHILAHGSGSLLLHALQAQQPERLAQCFQHPDNLILLLGDPPLQGRADLIPLLTGTHRLIRLLTQLTGQPASASLLARQFAQYTGLLEQLPDTLLEARTWQARLRQPAPWHDPTLPRTVLQTLHTLRQPLPKALMSHLWLIRGQAPLTPLPPDSEGRLLATRNGDGVSPWLSPEHLPIPPERCMHWLVEQGRLPLETDLLPTLAQILEGSSDLPDMAVPCAERGPEHPVFLPPLHKVPQPSDSELTAAALGFHTRQTREESLPPVTVEVLHGDLRHAPAPVMVGHYRGDGLFSAEKALDKALQGRLRQHHRLDTYPGALNTSRYFHAPESRPPGALVIGLGEVGALTARSLQDTLHTALLDYLLQVASDPAPDLDTDNPLSFQPVEIATLLIGATDESGLSIQDSLRALLRAITDVNALLCKTATGPLYRLQRLFVVELFEDRALEAAHALDELLNQTPFLYAFQLQPSIRTLPGRQYRIRHGSHSRWWQRMQIEADPQGQLHYRMLTRRARVEVRLQQTQRRLVDRFIQTARATLKDDRELGKTLFELLLPTALREQLQSRDALVLLLNREAAHYPWELLQDPQDRQQQPLAIQTRLIRQLQLRHYREHLRHPVQRTALVIGDPITQDFPRLDAAAQEARQVSDQLSQGGFQVTREIRTNASSIIQALHRQPWRVLHLAGHGVFEHTTADGQTVTGIAMSDGLFLTAAEIGQMRQVPELVFINACHLAQLPADMRYPQNKLAASLAEALIGMGVRAVIAAGWAIEDRAAALFSNTFYAALLRGETLGEAIHQARRLTWRRFPQYNTWGAYQCYGTPDYQLVTQPASPAVAMRADAPPPPAPRFFSPHEALIRLQNMEAALYSRPTEPDTLRNRLRLVWQALPPDWRTLPALRLRMARLWLLLDQPDEALALLPEHITAGPVFDQLEIRIIARMIRLSYNAHPDESATDLAKATRHLIHQWKQLETLLSLSDDQRQHTRLLLWLQIADQPAIAPDTLPRQAEKLDRLARKTWQTAATASPESLLLWQSLHLLRYRNSWIRRLQRSQLKTAAQMLEALPAPSEEKSACQSAHLLALPAAWLRGWQAHLLPLLMPESAKLKTEEHLAALRRLLAETPAPPLQRHLLRMLLTLMKTLAQSSSHDAADNSTLIKALDRLIQGLS